MPILLTPALIAAGVSATAAPWLAVGGTLLIGLGLQLISGLLKSKQPKPSDGQVIIKEATSPRFRSYGRVKIAGVLMFAGAKDQRLERVFAMGSGEIDDVEEHWIDDNLVTLDLDTWDVTGPPQYLEDHANRVRIEFYLGTDSGYYYSALNTKFPADWTSEHLGKGIPHAWVRLWQPKKEHFASVFPQAGDTLYRQVQRGAKIRLIDEDFEFTEPAWGDNAAAVIMDYLTHPDGLGLDDSWVLNAAESWRNAIDACVDDVAAYTEGTEKRYRIWNTYYFDERPADILSRFLQACDGILYTTPERGIALKVGKYEAPTVTIDDDAILAFTDFGHGRDILTTANTIRARFTNPDKDYQEYEVPVVSDDDDVAFRGEIASDIELFPVPSIGQAQRLMQIALSRAQPNWKGTIVCNLRALPAWGERFVNVIISELGVNETFEILGERLIISEGNIVSGLELDIASSAYGTAVPAVAACINGEMDWRNATTAAMAGPSSMPPDRVDEDGRSYVAATQFTPSWIVYDADGGVLDTLSYNDLWQKITDYTGIAHIAAGSTCRLWPIYKGRYILLYVARQVAGEFANWWALLEPGSLDVLGAYYVRGFTHWPYAGGIHILGATSEDQPILVQVYSFIGAWNAAIGVLPSIAEFKDGTYNLGLSGEAYRISNTAIYPVGGGTESDTDFGNKLFLIIPGNFSRNWGFVLPAADNTSNLYIYVNRLYMDRAVSAPTQVPPEFVSTIQPAYPNGCMVKIPLGNITFSGLSATPLFTSGTPQYRGAASGAYEIDNANWLDADGNPAIPFLDEYTYMSDDTAGGDDCYSLQTGIIDRGGGKFWIVFYMVGKADAAYRNGENPPYTHPIYDRIRVFEYHKSTETARQIAQITCVLHTEADIPPDTNTETWESSNDNFQIFTATDEGGVATLHINGHSFKRPFCTVTVPVIL